jgi:hypothetical protein
MSETPRRGGTPQNNSTAEADRLAMAERHVRTGRAIVERQRKLIAGRFRRGDSTGASEALLVTFEQSQAIFEADLVRLRRRMA